MLRRVCLQKSLQFHRTYAKDLQFDISTIKFSPLADRLLIKPVKAETKTKNGIMIPEKSSGKSLRGQVVATGPGIFSKNGSVTPLAVKVGNHVLLSEYGGSKISINDQDYVVCRESDVLGIIEE